MKQRILLLLSTLFFCLSNAFAIEVGQMVRIVNRNKTLSIQDSYIESGKPAVMWTETNTHSQRWIVEDTGRGTFFLKNVYSELYLGTVSIASTGTSLSQIARTQAITRGSWELVPVEGQEDTYVIYNGTSRRLALTANEKESDGASVTLQIPNESLMPLMHWKVEVVETAPNCLTESIRDDMMEKWKAQYYKKANIGYVIGKGGWWGDAEMFEVVLDALETTGNPMYATMFDMLYQNFCSRNGTDWSGNAYNDDIAWMCIACVRAYLLTGKVEYRTRAKSNFDKMYARANAYGNGTLIWKQGNTGTNSCINGPATVCACYLGIAFGMESYFQKAAKIYAGQRSLLYNINSSGVFNGHVYDSYSTEENKVSNTWASTYNQGTSLGAAMMLYNHYGDPLYKNDADAIMSWTDANLANSNDIIKVCQTVTGDLTGFKGILLRYVRRYAAEFGHPEYYDWLAKNAYHAWNNRNSKGISMSAWLHKTPENFYYSDGGDFSQDGVGAFTALSAAFNAHLGVKNQHQAYERIEAEQFNFLRGTPVVDGDDEDGTKIAGPIRNQQYIGYRNVDFGSSYASELCMRVNLSRLTGILKVYADEPSKGTLLASIGYSDIKSSNKWVDIKIPLLQPITGVHDIYLVASGTANVDLVSVNYFNFESNYKIYADATNNGGKITSSFESSSASLQALVDDNPLTEFNSTQSDVEQCWLQYESSSPIKLQGYVLFSALTKSQDPVSWTLQASNDGVEWTDLDQQDSVLFEQRGQRMQFDVPTTTSYSTYRLLIRERNAEKSLSLSEWQLLGENISSTDITADGGTALSGFETLFDHNATTAQTLTLPVDVDFSCTGPYILSAYSITAPTISEAPAAWTLYGSNNGRKWEVIHQQTDQSFPYDGATQVYSLSPTSSYTSYRVSFEGADSSNVSVSEVQLFGFFDFGTYYPDVASVSQVTASDGSDASALLDKNGYTIATLAGESMKWRFEFPIPTKIISYSMVSADDPAFNPLDITLEGIEDDGTTSTVSTRTVEFDYVGARENYNVVSTKLFTHANLNVLSTYGGTNVTRLADVEIYGTSIASEGSTILPSVQSVTASKGGLTTSEDIDKLSDFNKANMYRAVYVEPIAITYTYATPQVIDTYALTASKSNDTRDPKSWILEASNNGTTWTILDEQTAQSFSNRYATQFYRIANKAEYTQYRITILENGGEPQLQIGELQFLQMNASTSIQSPSSALEAATLYVSSGILSVNTNVQGHLSVYDLQGRLLQTQAITAGTSQVSIQHLPTGTYVASLQINGKRRLLKFFK